MNVEKDIGTFFKLSAYYTFSSVLHCFRCFSIFQMRKKYFRVANLLAQGHTLVIFHVSVLCVKDLQWSLAHS